jgi:chemosensory pili system protein ChpA (sensor histidine kinase/response regulator)
MALTDPELRGIFIEEADEYIATLEALLVPTRTTGADRVIALRTLHSLKGVAAVAEQMPMSGIAKRLEHALEQIPAPATLNAPAVVPRARASLRALREMSSLYKDGLDDAVDAVAEELDAAWEVLAVIEPQLRAVTAQRLSPADVPEHPEDVMSVGEFRPFGDADLLPSAEPRDERALPGLDDHPLFVIEASEHMNAVEQTIRRLAANAGDAGAVNLLRSEWIELLQSAEAAGDGGVAEACRLGLPVAGPPEPRPPREQWLDPLEIIALQIREMLSLPLDDARRGELLEVVRGVAGEIRLSMPVRPASDSIGSESIGRGSESADSVNPQMLEYFLPEATEQLESLNHALLTLEADRTNHDAINTVFRCTHTLKGSAATVGLSSLADFAHEIESRVSDARDGTEPVTEALLESLFRDADRLRELIRGVAASPAAQRPASRPGDLKSIARPSSSVYANPRFGIFADEARPLVEALRDALARVALPLHTTDALQTPLVIAQKLYVSARAAEFNAGMRHAEEMEQLLIAVVEDISLFDEEILQALDGAAREYADLIEAIERERQLSIDAPAAAMPTAMLGAPGATGAPGVDDQLVDRRTLRIDAETLDDVLDLVGELVIARSKLKKLRQELRKVAKLAEQENRGLKSAVDQFVSQHEFTVPVADENDFDDLYNPFASELGSFTPPPAAQPPRVSDEVALAGALRGEFGAAEFDEYSAVNILARTLNELTHRSRETDAQLENLLATLDNEIEAFSNIVDGAKDRIMALRMVPLRGVFSRLPRVIRDAAKAAGKQVRLQITGADTRIDKVIADEIADALIQIVRNAVAHGVELPEMRHSLEKDETGTVHVWARTEGSRVTIGIEDDGQGVDALRVRELAVARGLVSPEMAPRLTDEQLIEILFLPGFSTTTEADSLSGRGVGLDVVKYNVSRVGGTISAAFVRGQGTTFTISLPQTLTVFPGMVVRVGAEQFVLPLAAIDSTDLRALGEIDRRDQTESINLRGEDVPLLRLQRLQPETARLPATKRLPIVIVGRERKVALMVDELVGIEDIVVRDLGAFLAPLRLYSGGAILGDGRLRLVLDPGFLIELAAGEAEGVLLARPTEEHRVPSVLLVDDSLSIRRVVAGFLRSGGYRVDAAIDGQEAWEKLQLGKYDLVFTDLEMPRMHGYELLARLRESPRHAHIPVVVLSSRSGDKHRAKAAELGANEYLVKPVQQREMLRTARQVLDQARARRPTTAPDSDATSITAEPGALVSTASMP